MFFRGTGVNWLKRKNLCHCMELSSPTEKILAQFEVLQAVGCHQAYPCLQLLCSTCGTTGTRAVPLAGGLWACSAPTVPIIVSKNIPTQLWEPPDRHLEVPKHLALPVSTHNKSVSCTQGRHQGICFLRLRLPSWHHESKQKSLA